MPTSVPNFNFLSQLVSEIWGGPKIKSGSSWFPQTPLVNKFLYRALLRANVCKCAKLQLPSSISYRDMRGSQNKKWELWFPQTPTSGQIFVPGASTRKCLYSVPNFNFLARLVSEIRGGPKIKSGSSWFPQTPSSGQIFYTGRSYA